MMEEAIEALGRGEVVLIYDFDSRERETDLVMAAEFMTPKHLYQLRRDAGGLICTAIDPLACSAVRLPYFVDILRCACAEHSGNVSSIGSLCERAGDLTYDSKSSFSIWVNHRNTFTGITDVDRSLTITALAEAAKKALQGCQVDLSDEFRSPGHVPVLRAAPGLIKDRRGQTELSIALARAAGVTPATVVCEMLDGETGRALSKDDAMKYARDHGLAFVEGEDVVELYNRTMALAADTV